MLVLRVVPYEIDRHHDAKGPVLAEREHDFGFLKCLTLNHDLSVHECFLAELPSGFRRPLEALRRLGRPRTPKSSSRVRDDFIVANRLLDEFTQEHRANQASGLSTKLRVDNSSAWRPGYLPPPEHQWTIDLQWLADHINNWPLTPFDEVLEFALRMFHDRLELNIRGIVSM